MNRRSIGLLTTSHFIIDINQGALPAMLPFLISERHLSYASAAALVFAANISSSIVQPLFGFYSDKISALWTMPVGILLAGLGIGFAGILPSYWAILISVAISGIGVAAFHPEAARLANNAAGEKKTTGISIFSAGGNIGFAVGPIITTAILIWLGLKGSLLLIIPVLITSIVLLLQLSGLSKFEKKAAAKASASIEETIPDDWKAFGKLAATLSCRSIIFFGFNTFLPLYWIHVLGQTKVAGSTALTVLIVIGAVSTLMAGRAADRFGNHKIIRLGYAALIPLLFIFINISNVKLATFMLVPIGLALYAPYSPMVVLGQKYLPSHMGLASGVTLGLAVSVGGVFAPALGWVSDHYGIHAAISCLVVVPVIATVLASTLPVPKTDMKIIEAKKATFL